MRAWADSVIRIGAILAAVIGLASHYAWGDVVSDSDGRFTINFPAKASESTQTVDTKAGKAQVHVYRAEGDNKAITYTALYSDYPSGSIARSPADAIYDGAIKGAVGQGGGKVVSNAKVSNGTVAGREAVFSSPDQAETMRVRYFLVGDRLYQVAYHGPKGSETSKTATTFLDSFKISN